jgi:hypothetical protein
MTVEAKPFVAENTIAPVSADHGTLRRRSAYPVHSSTTGLPSRYTDSAPPPSWRVGNKLAKLRIADECRTACSPQS